MQNSGITLFTFFIGTASYGFAYDINTFEYYNSLEIPPRAYDIAARVMDKHQNEIEQIVNSKTMNEDEKLSAIATIIKDDYEFMDLVNDFAIELNSGTKVITEFIIFLVCIGTVAYAIYCIGNPDECKNET